jgi:ribonuclease HI
MVREAVAYTDGSSRGNPGEAGVGVVILDEKEQLLKESSRYIGHATNNVAEYQAVLLALKELKLLGMERVEIRTDSKLVQSQLTGAYKIKDRKLVAHAIECMKLLGQFNEWCVTLIPREENVRADRLAQKAVDKRRKKKG